MDVSDLRFFQDLVHKVRRDESNTFRIPENDVAGHYRSSANAHRHVDPTDHYVPVAGGSGAAEIAGRREFPDAIQVTNTAVNDKPRLGSGPYRGMQVVAAECAVRDLAEQIDNHNIVPL